MTESPASPPWPAPTLADLVLADAEIADPVPPSPDKPPSPNPTRHAVSALLNTAKRLSSRTERAEHAAAKEEQRISAELDDLPAGWFVLHSLDIDPDADARQVDHVAIGPAGVFMIFLEHQPGAKVWISEHKVTINGRDSDHLRQARFEARRASGRLTDACGFDVTVQSVLMLIDAATMQTLNRPAEVHVRTQHDIHDWLCRQPPRLEADGVRAVYDHLRSAEGSPSQPLSGLLE
jgi:Nuclease-related domain